MRAAFSREALPTTLAALGLVLAALSIITPWYSVDITVAGVHSPANAYTLTEYAQHNADGTTRVVPYDTNPCLCPNAERAFSQVQLLAWTGALVAAFAFWARGALPRSKSTLTLALSGIAGILLVAGPILLALDLPRAFEADHRSVGGVPAVGRWGSSFAGATETGLIRSAWGPAIGWILALLGGALTLAAIRRERYPTAAEAPAPAQTSRPAPSPLAAPPASPKQVAARLPNEAT